MKQLGLCTFFLFFLIHVSSAFCAAPIFHVYIAEKWLEDFEAYGEIEKQNFIVGTLFPDIRYLGELRREETHEIGIGITDILETTDPFRKGMRLHVFVDETRARILKELGIMNLLGDVPDDHKVTFLKFLEDAVLYSSGNWDHIRQYLGSFVPDPKFDYKVPNSSLNRWHGILENYFKHGPTKLLARLSASDQGYLGVPPHLIKQWAVLIPELSQAQFVQKYVSDLISGFACLSQPEPM
ncbi:MAG: hypothetical protein V4487_09260 [Chlamydiota bacterium]